MRGVVNAQFLQLFHRLVIRNVLRHPLLAVLNILSVALGVSVFLAIQIANHSASRSFGAGIDLVAGRAHLEISGDIAETLFPRVAADPQVAAATPLVKGVATLPDSPGEYLRILGFDLFTNEPFRTFTLRRSDGSVPSFETWLATPYGVAISTEFAALHGLEPGDPLDVTVNTHPATLRIIALLEPNEANAAADPRFAAMDIGWAQELFGTAGMLSSIQVQAHHPEKAEALARELRPLLPTNVEIAAPSQRSFQVEKMLAGFKLNLTALSMVAMLVGMFLIYNTISASAVRRRREIGILRSLGATRPQIRALFVGEALMPGLAGIAVGLFAGVGLGSALLGSVARTITSLYVLTSIDRAYLSPADLALGAALGFATVLVAAWFPANRAALTDPVDALAPCSMMDRQIYASPRWAAAGFVLLAVAFAVSLRALNHGTGWLGFVAAFLVLTGFACFAPAATTVSSLVLKLVPAILVRIAASNLARSLHRNAVTTASLAAAVAMMISVSVMIHSFRTSVERWISRSIVADLFIAPASNLVVGLGSFVPLEAIEFLKEEPEVNAVETFREIHTTLRGEPASLAVVEGENRRNLDFVGGGNAKKMRRFLEEPDVVLVTESFAQRFDLREADPIALPTPKGERTFEIGGIYYDYTTDQGVILMSRRNFARYWDDPRVQTLAVYLEPGADPSALEEDFRRAFSAHGEFVLFRNRELRRRILQIFDQTFAVTYVLRIIAVIVAVVGIFLSFTTLVAERQREIGVLRSVGAAREQIRRLLIYEAGALGLVSSLLGLAAGVCLSLVLTWVINRAFFGWTIALEIPWLLLLAAPIWIGAASVAAAWVPALRAGRIAIATAIREE